MQEYHKREQYFFDKETISKLAYFASQFENPCCLCAPTLGVELEKRDIKASTLDIDDRFSDLKGFIQYDLYKPKPIAQQFGIIICDPPFNIVKLSQLFNAIRILNCPKIWISFLEKRKFDIMATFAMFNLEETGFFPQYHIPQAVRSIQFYGN